MEKIIEKAKVLIEALPYIKEFNSKIVVIKYGGSAMIDEIIQGTVIEDIVLMKLVGLKPVIVHGGGKEISEVLKTMNIKSEFINGIRVTDKDTVDVVEMVLSGKINKGIVQLIQNHGINAVGISGKDGKTLKVKKKEADDIDYGFVGDIEKVETGLIMSLLDNDFIPVIAPVGTDNKGQTYNINADYAASAIAGALNAEKLLFLTDVEGVLSDVNDKSTLISKIEVSEVEKLIEDGIISGGMIPKVECCVQGIKYGVKNVHILDGTVEHCMIIEIFTKNGIGTMFGNKFEY